MMNNKQHKPAAAPDVALDKQTAASGKPQPIIGRLMDQISALPVLWGLNEPGALLRNSDVLRVLAAAGREQAASVQTQEPVAAVYPPDGTVSPFTVINLGHGLVKMGDSLHDGRLPALWFGTDGLGMGVSEEMNRAAKAGETLAVVTFANVEGLDVLCEVVQRIRSVAFPGAPSALGDARDLERLAIEEKAQEIYSTWQSQPEFVAWQQGGNSHMQERARDMARATITAKATS